MNAPLGHNESTVRLALLASDAALALERVARGETDAIAGWLAYGAALNEGRGLFHPEDDKGFGQWLYSSNLEENTHPADRSAAMWAAANPEQFDAARAAGGARTVRGIHAKWQEMDAERRAAEERARAEAERAKAEAERAEARARADAEAAARKAERDAKDEAARKAARERAEREATAKAEAERKARASEKTARAADRSAKAAEKRIQKARLGAAEPTKPHVAQNSGENEWYTPGVFIEAARSVLGGIDLDPASSEVANRTVQAARFYTVEDDGLKQDWPVGRIWMNPPYAQPLMGQFAAKYAAEIRKGSTGIVLVNNATETVWFQAIVQVSAAVCFPQSRIRFIDQEGVPSGAPLQGQAILYAGPDPDGFEAAFGSFGVVLRHG